MTDFKELREALDADLKIPWNRGISEDASSVIWIGGVVEPPLSMGPDDTWIDCGTVEMARYIAAANPAVIRSLLAELDAARRDAERLALLLSHAEQAEDGWRIDVWISGAPSLEEITDALDAMKEQRP